MIQPLDRYYAVPVYNTQEAAKAAGLNPPPFDKNKPIKTWFLPAEAARLGLNFSYSGIQKSEDGNSATVETILIPRKEVPLLNVPPGIAIGGDERIDVSYAYPIPLKPLPEGAKLVVGWGGVVSVDLPDAKDGERATTWTVADQERLKRIEALLATALGR